MLIPHFTSGTVSLGWSVRSTRIMFIEEFFRQAQFRTCVYCLQHVYFFHCECAFGWVFNGKASCKVNQSVSFVVRNAHTILYIDALIVACPDGAERCVHQVRESYDNMVKLDYITDQLWVKSSPPFTILVQSG